MKTALVEAAWSASRTKGSEFQTRYETLRGRLGHKRALVAVAHLLVLRLYEVLSTAKAYQSKSELPPRNLERLIRHHTRRLSCLHRWLTPEKSA